jgi:hypothetical protein
MENPEIKTQETFNFPEKEQIAKITIHQLAQSRNIVSSSGKPFPNRPEHPALLLRRIHELLEKAEISFLQEDIIVSKLNSSKDFELSEMQKEGFDPLMPVPFNKWVFHKLITRIVIPNEYPPKHNGVIAVAYNQSGVQIAFGLNYTVCSNLCILGGKGSILSTSGLGNDNAIEYYEMIERVTHFINDFKQVCSVNGDIVKAMQKVRVNLDNDMIPTLIGHLFIMTVNSGKGERKVPFLKDDIYRFVMKLREAADSKEIKNAYDLYNVGTSILIPENVGLESIIVSNRLWAEFIIKMIMNTDPDKLTNNYLKIINT